MKSQFHKADRSCTFPIPEKNSRLQWAFLWEFIRANHRGTLGSRPLDGRKTHSSPVGEVRRFVEGGSECSDLGNI